MTDQQTNTGAPGGSPGGSPGGDTSGNTGGSFVRARAAQMMEKMQQQAQGDEPAADVGEQRQQQEQQRSQEQQQQQAPEKIKVGDAEYDAAELQAAIAARREAEIRKSGLPSTPEAFEAKLSPNFQPPVDGVTFQIDPKSPELAAVRKVALKHGMSQEAFSDLLDVYAAGRIGDQAGQLRAREANLAALGAAGPQRIESVSVWLQSVAGKDGAALASFLKQWPSAPIVRSVETIIKRFSNQGGADYSGQHRETPDAEPGKIPGYDKMSFAQIRARQMAERLKNDPSYAHGQRPGGRE